MKAGDQIDGTAYEVIRELGRGGTAITYLGRHIEHGRKVAIKLVQPVACWRKHTVDRFFREARALCRIDHPNVVKLYDFPELPAGIRCLIMEHIEGVLPIATTRGNSVKFTGFRRGFHR